MPSEHPTLSVVMPVYNEPDWIARSVTRVADQLANSPWAEPEIIVVDDGSTDRTAEVLATLSVAVPVRVITTENNGRFLARRTGIGAANGEFVLLLDARVLLEGDLTFVNEQVAQGHVVWNAHCDVNANGNLLALFWDALPRIFWSAYYGDPRTLSYGIEDFVRYPKGTTCFFAPTALLLEAYGSFTTKYGDLRDANDDTALIEHMARRERIWISPQFACRYEPRQRLSRFAPHAFHRGIVFVDAYLKPGNPYAAAIVAFCAGSVGLLLAFPRRPWVPPAALISSGAVAAGVGLARRLPAAHVLALAVVTPLFVVSYGLGIWKGLLMAARQRLNRKDAAAYSN